MFDFIENNIEDAESEVALNLICVDESTRQTIDIPIRPRSVREFKKEMNKKHNRSNDVFKIDLETKHKVRIDRTDTNVRTGKDVAIF